MRMLVRRLGVTLVALSFALCSIPSDAVADEPTADQVHAVMLLQQGCGAKPEQAAEVAAAAQVARTAQVAQASPEPPPFCRARFR